MRRSLPGRERNSRAWATRWTSSARVPARSPRSTLIANTARSGAARAITGRITASRGEEARLRIIVQPRSEPAFHFGDWFAFARGEIGHLVAVEFADGEILRLGMREVEPADAASGPHGETLGEFDAGVRLHVEQLPENALLGVIGARGITGRRTDAAILFLDEVFRRKLLGPSVSPLVTNALVEKLGEGFGQSVGQRLRHDGVVGVVP